VPKAIGRQLRCSARRRLGGKTIKMGWSVTTNFPYTNLTHIKYKYESPTQSASMIHRHKVQVCITDIK
jgi:hypothetical protein